MVAPKKHERCEAAGCENFKKFLITFNWKKIKVCQAHKILDGSHFYYESRAGGWLQCRCKKQGHK